MESFKHYLTEAQNLKKDVDAFVKDDEFYKYMNTPEDFQGACDGVSSDLYKYLTERGYKVKLIEGIGAKFNLADNHPHIKIPQYVSHVVLQAGNKVVDLTGHQFGFEKVRIIPAAEFKKQWGKIKPFKAWDRG